MVKLQWRLKLGKLGWSWVELGWNSDLIGLDQDFLTRRPLLDAERRSCLFLMLLQGARSMKSKPSSFSPFRRTAASLLVTVAHADGTGRLGSLTSSFQPTIRGLEVAERMSGILGFTDKLVILQMKLLLACFKTAMSST